MKAVKTVKKHFAPPSPQSAIVCRHKLLTAENDFNSLIQLNYESERLYKSHWKKIISIFSVLLGILNMGSYLF